MTSGRTVGAGAAAPGGRCPLTPLEARVLRLLATGRTRFEAADQIGASLAAVHAMLEAIAARLGARTTAQALVIALRAGWLDLEHGG